jgi:hypothetical protein
MRAADGPSLALSISRANGGFYYTGFYSYQDTVRPLLLFCLTYILIAGNRYT